MAYAKLETTGLAVRKGKVQIRFSFYLEPGDARYDEHHVQVTVFPDTSAPLNGYPRQMTYVESHEEWNPIDEKFFTMPSMWLPDDDDDYQQWLVSLPRIWQSNPFHSHFVYVNPDVTDGEIRKLMRDYLREFYGIWSKGQDITKVWKPKGRLVPGDMSPDNIGLCEAKVIDIKLRAPDFEQKEIA